VDPRIKAKITRSWTTYKKGDGTLSVVEASPEEMAEFQINFDDRLVADALEAFRAHRDLEPLLELLVEAHPALMRNYEARDLIARAARGEPIKGRKKGTGAASKRRRDSRIWSAAYFLHDMGIPLSNHPDATGKEPPVSVCRMIGERLNLSEKTIHSVVNTLGGVGRKKTLTTEILTWKLAGEPVEPEWVLDHYFGDYPKGGQV
jgi:hypothetical protein